MVNTSTRAQLKRTGRPKLRSLLKDETGYRKVFFIALAMAIGVFLPFILLDSGYFLFYGDYNVQQIPFYQMCHDAVQRGDIFWSFTTDLGANFMSSYSFYLLGSPFFWLTLPFPSHIVPYLMGPLFILKFACAATTGFAFIKRFVKNKDYAIIGGILYAFSGFSVFNIFFNHFHEPMIFFPLLLVAVEEFMINRRGGVLAAAVALNAIVNYFFFAGMVTFVIIYVIIRLLSGAWKLKWGRAALFVLETVVGLLLSAFILLPSLITLFGNPRVDSFYTGHNALLYGYVQRYGQLFTAFFFPPDLPATQLFFPDAETKWASVAGWLPLFGMVGVISFIKAKKGNWLKRIFITCLIMAFVPVLNSMFFMFNAAYYGRWFYMPILMMCLMTVVSLEDKTVDWRGGLTVSLAVTAFISLFMGFYPQKYEQDGETSYRLGLFASGQELRYLMYTLIAFASILLTYIVVRRYRDKGKKFLRVSLISVITMSVIYSIFIIAAGKIYFSGGHAHKDFLIPYSLNGGKEIDLPDMDKFNYRIDTLEVDEPGLDNQAMFWQLPTIQAFQSIIPASVMEFYPLVGVQRDVGSRPDIDHYGLRSLLSVRWQFNYDNVYEKEDEDVDTMPGYTFYDWQNGYNIYENDNYIPMGFAYDKYITRLQFDDEDKDYREFLLLKGILLDAEQIKRHRDIVQPLDLDNIDYEYEDFVNDCEARGQYTAYNFRQDNFGFEADFDSGDTDKLVFFSIPYEKGLLKSEGWTATIDGEPVTVENINIGFMAVRVPAGVHHVRFNYMTPGIIIGVLVTAGAIAVLLIYLILVYLYRKRRLDARVIKSGWDSSAYENRIDAPPYVFPHETKPTFIQKLKAKWDSLTPTKQPPSDMDILAGFSLPDDDYFSADENAFSGNEGGGDSMNN